VHGIGPVKAKELVTKHQVTSIDDLRNLLKTTPKLLNEKQKIGLRYYEALMERIPREEMVAHEKLLKGMRPKGWKMDVVGSYRRRKETSGDIDVLLGVPKTTDEKSITSRFEQMVESLKSSGYILEVLALGSKKCMAICTLPGENPKPRRLDLLVTPPSEYAYALLYFTGSDKFNIQTRKTALARGYTLNEHTMKPVRDDVGVVPPMKTEKDIFAFLEIPYISPEDRG